MPHQSVGYLIHVAERKRYNRPARRGIRNELVLAVWETAVHERHALPSGSPCLHFPGSVGLLRIQKKTDSTPEGAVGGRNAPSLVEGDERFSGCISIRFPCL